MPNALLKPCRQPGCSALSERGYCTGHERQQKAHLEFGRDHSAARGYGSHWRKVRAIVVEEEPFCRTCRVRPTKFVDHIIPKRAGGTDDRSNLQGLCIACNIAKTWKDVTSQNRGRGGNNLQS